MQGDLLFTDDKKNAVVNGEKSIVFTPNTITYAVPTTSVDMYNRIRFDKDRYYISHFIFNKTMKGLQASFGASVNGFETETKTYSLMMQDINK